MNNPCSHKMHKNFINNILLNDLANDTSCKQNNSEVTVAAYCLNHDDISYGLGKDLKTIQRDGKIWEIAHVNCLAIQRHAVCGGRKQ